MIHRPIPWRWAWLLALCAAPVIVVALTQDIGARAYDAASEHILRGVAFSSVVSEGILYPRWSGWLHWGLGSPLFTFQPPLPYLGLDFLHRLGLSHALGWRVLVAVGFALAFVGAYLLAYEIGRRRWPALLAAVAFTYAPYVLRNALERGSNEAYSVFLYPLVLWSLIALARRPAVGRFLLATAFWAACIGSHVLGPLILAPFAAGLAIFLALRYRTLGALGALLVGGLLMAFIWLPMGPEQAWVHVARDFSQPEAMPAHNPIRLAELLAPPVVYDMARDDNRSGDRVGFLQSLLLLGALPAAAWRWRTNRKLAAALLATALVGLFLFFLLTPSTDWLWRLGGSLAARLLYRTRLMGAQALAAALAGGLLTAALGPALRRWMAPLLTVAFVVASLPALYVQQQHAYAAFEPPIDRSDVRAMEIRHGGTALTAFGEFEPKWRTAGFDDTLLARLGPDFDAERQPFVNGADEVAVRSADVRNQSWDVSLSVPTAVTATLNLLYYPRWRATLDGAAIPLSPEPVTGYVQVGLPAGEHRLVLHYGRTAAEWAGLFVSALTLLGLIMVCTWLGLRRRRTERRQAPLGMLPPAAGRATVPVSVLLGLTGLLALKFVVIDPYTSWFRCASTSARVCGAQATVDVAFQGAHRLRGYTVESAVVPVDGEVRLRLYWEAVAGTGRPLAAFVHVRNASPDQPPSPYSQYGIWSQKERAAWGVLRSTEMVPGKLYEDVYALHLPPDMPAGEYNLEVGWFDPATGEQIDVVPETIAPLRVLWRSVLLPNLHVTGR